MVLSNIMDHLKQTAKKFFTDENKRLDDLFDDGKLTVDQYAECVIALQEVKAKLWSHVFAPRPHH